ncbi:GNAT family N-acetyltransferase [Sulfobacillus thermosulfidooxidans]|uniref:GNAT family N-acetyltransferase n=1 Tax=Sulfobacillus thermosulfidooxidans TaxID=28034 RepID=UPI00096BA1CE|nr:GNAT family N-acetyltransferase [Sulfobacillus thermosulfidooxidans]OLZ08775.1 hypothetical protein BFX05_15280 [Sulfobacillus thermosulfidooxidans]OLZ14805.1 hypothetical protein BFX06_05755 [Sulfobacillus thermosulfidooxidans]OLZ22051.1 hypothetical protein BFX07_10615 [Sulfobacillus thermosulfidooxidans]
MIIKEVCTPGEWQVFRELLEEYTSTLDFSVEFQNFSTEITNLSRIYCRPYGVAILALANTAALGCVAYRQWAPKICEMKRLFVRPAYRQQGVARQLISRMMSIAKNDGYHVMRLDTVPSMTAAIHLYLSLGFHDIPAYYSNPVPGARFMEITLNHQKHDG